MSQYSFKFNVEGTENDALVLLQFSGHEAISTLYDFELELRCFELDLDEEQIINKSCQLQIFYGKSCVRQINGLVVEFEDVKYLPDHTLYRARVVPRAWKLGLFDTNEVYLDEGITETLTCLLEECGLTKQDFRFDFVRDYRKWPFRLQYKETHLAFLQRIIEREGIYYYFEQSSLGEVMVFCDGNQYLQSVSDNDIEFQANAGLNVATNGNTVSNIVCKRQCLPKSLTLRDFNEECPSLDVKGEADIDPHGTGEINHFGLNIVSPEEGGELARVHAQAYLCRKKEFVGEGDCAVMSAGYTFKLQQHPRKQLNKIEYLLESVCHEGANLDEFRQEHPDIEMPSSYVSSFVALSTEVEFAPQRKANKPEIYGTLNAVIDAESDGEYPELDEVGRYKVVLPFDRKSRDGGKASYWIRMMQPFGGANEGMHFPLRKGTRVLLSFIGGDPDRPVIAGTISDSSEQSSIVNSDNQTNKVLQTATGNKIEMEDQEGKNRIKIESPTNDTYLHLGAPNHDGSGIVMMTEGIERREVNGGQRLTIVASKVKKKGDSVIKKDKKQAVDKSDLFTFHSKNNAGAGFAKITPKQEISGEYLIERRKGPKYLWTDGDEYVYGGGNVFNFGNSYEESHANYIENTKDNEGKTGIDDKTLAIDFLGEQEKETFSIPSSMTGAKRWTPGDHEVEKKWTDTYSYQKGYNYTWGDTCDYEFGNGYAETHVDTDKNPDGSAWSGINYGKWDKDAFVLGAKKIKSTDSPVQSNYSPLSLDPDLTGVEKSLGDSYEYSQGKSIEINFRKRTEEYTYGGESYEATYNGDNKFVTSEHKKAGVKTEITRSLGGSREEKEIVDVTGVGKVTETHVSAYGNPVSYEIVREPTVGTKFSFLGDGLPTLTMSLETNVGATEITTTLGVMDNKLTVEGLGMSNEVKFGGALMENKFTMEKTLVGTEIVFDGLGLKKFESDLPGLQTRVEAQKLKLEKEALCTISDQMIAIEAKKVEVANFNASLATGSAKLDLNAFIMMG